MVCMSLCLVMVLVTLLRSGVFVIVVYPSFGFGGVTGGMNYFVFVLLVFVSLLFVYLVSAGSRSSWCIQFFECRAEGVTFRVKGVRRKILPLSFHIFPCLNFFLITY